MPVAILALGVVSVVLWFSTDILRKRLAEQEVALIRAASEIRVDVAVSHLWLEEYVTGDPGVDLQAVWDSLDKAQALTRAMLEGGNVGERGILLSPLGDPALRAQAERLRTQIAQLRETARRRLEGHRRGEETGIGSPFDAHFDRIFDTLSDEAKALERAVETQMVQDERRARLLLSTLMVGWIALVSAAAGGLWTREKHRRAAEAALRRSEAQLLQAQKMDAVGRLAGGLAHDINNYINAITSQCELVQMKSQPGDRVYEKMEMVIATAGKITALIRRLLAFSKQKPTHVRVIDLNEVVDGLRGMMKRLLREDIQLETFLPVSLWSVCVDPSQVEQIVVNLLVNAREASPRGGKVTIETANVFLDRDYLKGNPNAIEGNYVLLAVSDSGTGIPPEIRDRIFEPFFTTKEAGSEARGLGLATVYGIVKQYGGHLAVYSEVGRGTTFKIYFPRATDTAERAAARAVEVAAGGGTETILLIEDNDELRGSTHGVLEALGYRVVVAASGEEALVALDEEDGEVDLVISDVVMPGMSGPEVVHRLRQRDPAIRAIFISGYTDNVVLRHGILEGEFEFLEKPYSVNRLAAKIREVLSKPAQPSTLLQSHP
ncbi:MAG TPA: ATP-binding protein [Thermoanaerobaculia bacterium]|nr:ATP-binding protein [Thermoanaerobaculia bacterium]